MTVFSGPITVHGFAEAVYNVLEEESLDTTFELNVKGMTSIPNDLVISGIITAMPGGTASKFKDCLIISFPPGESDFEQLQPDGIQFTNSADIRLSTRNDMVTLEYDDYIIMTFTSDNSLLIGGLESLGEYVRNTAIVNILDNDCKCGNHKLQFITLESFFTQCCRLLLKSLITQLQVMNPLIRLKFRSVQSPFNIILSPVTIATAERMGLGSFINSDNIEGEARATAGELDIAGMVCRETFSGVGGKKRTRKNADMDACSRQCLLLLKTCLSYIQLVKLFSQPLNQEYVIIICLCNRQEFCIPCTI